MSETATDAVEEKAQEGGTIATHTADGRTLFPNVPLPVDPETGADLHDMPINPESVYAETAAKNDQAQSDFEKNEALRQQ